MKHWNVEEGCSIYQILDKFFNAYLIVIDQEAYLIDTGRQKDSQRLEQNLVKILNGRTLKYLILTHTHYDHCGNAALIKEKWGPKIIVSKKESMYLKQGSTPLPQGTLLFTKILSNLGNRYATSWYMYESVNPEIEINGIYAISDNIKIITTPGHSDGSVSVVIKDQYVIVGDALFGSFKGSIMPHFADDKKQLYDSWNKLLMNTNCHTFLPGHGKSISRNRLEKELSKIK